MLAALKATTGTTESHPLVAPLRREGAECPFESPFESASQKSRHLFQAPPDSIFEATKSGFSLALFHADLGGHMLSIHQLPPGEVQDAPDCDLINDDKVHQAAHQLLHVASRVLGEKASAKDRFCFISGILEGPRFSTEQSSIDAHVPLGVAALRVAVFEALFV
ncbi:MAG: hypothetical protein GY822_20440 [Deltaproteobacteria bacterium]|nr:hypothetical protein [Deltaproteobacteria bacterium]